MLTGPEHEAIHDFAAASRTARESRKRSNAQGQHGGPIPPAAFLSIVPMEGDTPPTSTDNPLLCSVACGVFLGKDGVSYISPRRSMAFSDQLSAVSFQVPGRCDERPVGELIAES